MHALRHTAQADLGEHGLLKIGVRQVCVREQRARKNALAEVLALVAAQPQVQNLIAHSVGLPDRVSDVPTVAAVRVCGSVRKTAGQLGQEVSGWRGSATVTLFVGCVVTYTLPCSLFSLQPCPPESMGGRRNSALAIPAARRLAASVEASATAETTGAARSGIAATTMGARTVAEPLRGAAERRPPTADARADWPIIPKWSFVVLAGPWLLARVGSG
jgi:hypothetical protein